MNRWFFLTCLVGLAAAGYLVQTHLHGQAQVEKAPPADVISFRHVAKQVLPAVVSIESKTKVAAQGKRVVPRVPEGVPEEFRRFFEDFDFPDDAEPRLGFGSGFFINADGVVLTNFHVVSGAEQVTIQLADGRKFESKQVLGDRRTDLAVVKIDLQGAKVPFLKLGDSDAIELGDRVLAAGAPFGLTGSVTHGIVSAKGRFGLNMNMYEDFLQTDAAINPGNSGGPLVNLNGEVIGINAAIKSRSGGFQGVGLAVASNLAKKVTKALLTDGVVRRGYLGVQIRDLDPEVAQRLGLGKDEGIVVAEVFEDTPAAKAGLQPGDIIVAINGESIKDGRSLQNIVAGLPIGKAVNVAVLRDGKNLDLSVTIREQPAQFGTSASTPVPQPGTQPETTSVANIGVEVSDLAEGQAGSLGFRAGSQGALIKKVQPGSLASGAGLRAGMLITKVNGHAVTSAQSFQKHLDGASLSRGVVLQVQSPNGGTNFVLLRAVTR